MGPDEIHHPELMPKDVDAVVEAFVEGEVDSSTRLDPTMKQTNTALTSLFAKDFAGMTSVFVPGKFKLV